MKQSFLSGSRLRSSVFFISVVLLAGVLTSCGVQASESSGKVNDPDVMYISKYEYAEKEFPRVIEPLAYKELVPEGCSKLQIDNNVFYFAKSVSEKDRDVFVDNQIKLLDFLKSEGIDVPDLTMYVLKNYKNRTESEKKTAFFGIETSGTYEQVLTTLQVVYGDYTNYGLLYAMANKIAEKLSWKCDNAVETDTEALVSFLREKPEYLSLTYPCFDEIYSGQAEIEVSKHLALLIYDSMDKNATLNENTETAFSEAAEAFAEANKIEYTPVYFKFMYNGPLCPLKMLTKYLEIFRHSSYTEDYFVSVGILDKDWFADYTIMLETLKSFDNNIETVRSIFGVDSDQILKAKLCSIEVLNSDYSGSVKASGVYFGYLEKGFNIEFALSQAVLHEYAHYIYHLLVGVNDPEAKGWENESFASYFGLLSDIRHKIDNLLCSDQTFSEEFMRYTGEKYSDKDDQLTACDIKCFEKEIYSYTSGKSAWYYSFSKYFVDKYGEDTFIQAMLHPSEIVELTGKTMEEIIADWKENLINTYSGK